MAFLSNPINQQNIILNPTNKFYTFSFDPPEFYGKTAQIDYNLIKLGLEKSKEMSKRLNFYNHSKTKCEKCNNSV